MKPILSNIYHAQAVKQGQPMKQDDAKRSSRENGLEWIWNQKNRLPPKDIHRATRSKTSDRLMITESLFAETTTLIRWIGVLESRKQRFKKAMLSLEEKCHDRK